jgi:ketopantoate reductase
VVCECVAALGLGEEGEDEAAVARLHGAVVPLLSWTRGNVNSLLQDVLAGRGAEVEYLNGWVVRQAAKRGAKAPVNETLARLVRMSEAVAPADRVVGGAARRLDVLALALSLFRLRAPHTNTFEWSI